MNRPSSIVSLARSLSLTSSDEFGENDVGDPKILIFRNLHVSVEKKTIFSRLRLKPQPDNVVILNNVSARFESYRMIALMGSSGSGKTTLLNALNNNLPKKMKRTGTILFNNAKVNMRKISAYIQQNTLFYEQFTVKEHMMFYIKLNRKNNVAHNQEDDKNLLKELSEIFSLTKCLHTKIGDGISEGGISGGERKRLSIASELIKLPDIIFADEPTTGLDSFMAESIIQSLKSLSDHGLLVIITIHQPSTEIFKMFNDVCLLSAGNIITCNRMHNINRIFKLAGYPCPTHCNPADHIINATTCTSGNKVTFAKKMNKIQTISDLFNAFQMTPLIEEISVRKKKKHKFSTYKSSFYVQVWELMLRDFKTNTRDKLLLITKLIQNTIFSLVSSAVYYQMPFAVTNFFELIGSIFLLTLTGTITNIFSVVNNFPLEFNVYKRENRNMMYGPSAYFFARLLSEIPFNMIINLTFIFVSYFIIGYRLLFDSIAWTIFILFLQSEVEICFAYLISTIFLDVRVASSVSLGLTSIMIILGGFLVKESALPGYLVWLSYVSWFKYSLESIAIVQFADNQIVCNDMNIDHCQAHKTIEGTYYFDVMEFDKGNLTRNIVVLVCLAVLYRSISFIALIIRTRRT